MAQEQRITNVYLEKEAVESYLKIGGYDPQALLEMYDFIFKTCKLNKKNEPYILLDIGIGPGGFSIPLIEYFLSKNIDVYLDGFDISEEMLKKLEIKIQNSSFYPEIKKRINFWRNDAEEEFKNNRNLRDSYDAVIITFVLYYLKDPFELLEKVVRILKPGGFLIQSQNIGEFVYLDNNFASVYKNNLFTQFWKTYFEKRKKYNEWNPTISVSRFEPIYSFLEKMNNLTLVGKKDFIWYVTLSYEEILLWIEYSPFAALGAGLTSEDKYNLRKEMEDWLKEKKVNIKEKFKISIGVRLFIHKSLKEAI